MCSGKLFAAYALAILDLSALAWPASASQTISLHGTTSSFSYAGGIDPVMSATFNTGSSPVRAEIAALLFFSAVLENVDASATYTVSLDGGIPLSNLSFDPIEGLKYLNGSQVDLQGPAIKSVTFPVTALSTIPKVERFDQFASVQLNPNSLYWIEKSVNGDAVVEWGTTADVTGPGVASNYLAWDLTNEGFFLNKGVDPYPFDEALQMEIDTVPEPSTWAMMGLGFASLGFMGWRGSRRAGVA